MTDLTQSRRAVALRIAEAIDREWPNLNMEGFDIDEAMDIIETLIPLSAAEAESEMEALRDDGDIDDIPPSQPAVNPTIQAFRDAVGVQKMSIVDTIKTATELIHSLRAECASKEAELQRVWANYKAEKFNEGREVDAEPLDESY